MRDDLADVGQLRARERQQTVVDPQANAAHDGEIVLLHEIIHRVDRTCRAVFQRQHAVLAQPLLNGGEDLVERRAEEHARVLEQLVAGLLGIRALHALAGDSRRGGEQLRRRDDGPL